MARVYHCQSGRHGSHPKVPGML